MVEAHFISTVRTELEKYLIVKNNFFLNGVTYDLILLSPSERYATYSKYSLFISCKEFDSVNSKTAITDLLIYLKESLNAEYYSAISRINFIHSEDALVKSLKMVFGFRAPLFEINDYPIAGVHIEFAYLIKSIILDKLQVNSAVTIDYQIDGIRLQMNAGIKRMTSDFELIYYTVKGLKELFGPQINKTEFIAVKKLIEQSEEFLEEQGYIGRLKFDAILKIE